MPHLDGDLLKKIIPIHNSKCIRSHDFKEKCFVLPKPRFENILLFCFSHLSLIIYLLVPQIGLILTRKRKIVQTGVYIPEKRGLNFPAL